MNRRLSFCVICLVSVLCLWSTAASATRPVKEIPVRVVLVQPSISGWTTADHIMRQVEFANRVYANAGIQFKFHPTESFTDVWDNDLNCWKDDIVDDTQTANLYAMYYFKEMTVVVPTYRAEDEGATCNTGTCSTDQECCPNKWTFGSGGLECVEAVKCDSTAHLCLPSDYDSYGPRCFDSGCNALPDGCTISDNPLPAPRFIRFRPLDNPGIKKLAHETGHHLGLGHPWNTWAGRCYDQQETTVENCGPEPATCTGVTGACPVNPPWRNIMSYYSGCGAWYAGQLPASGWNESLSADQITIVRRALDEYWDETLDDDGDSGWPYGGYENMQSVTATQRWEWRGADTWDDVNNHMVSGADWTKGNVMIKAADVNGDGFMDAIATTPTGVGAHPNTTLWIRYSSGSLYFAQTLLATCGMSAMVQTGNVMGDSADEVIITCGSVTHVFEGAVGASSMTYGTSKNWGTTNVKVFVGNFGGTYQQPAGSVGARHDDHQIDVTTLGVYNNVSYDDILAIKSGSTEVYYGESNLAITTPDVSTTMYSTMLTSDVWAVNFAGDYHDEAVIRHYGNLRVTKGADAFVFGSEYTSLSYSLYDPLRVSLGDLTASHHGDMLITSPSGTKLYAGAMASPFWPLWTRLDLTTSNTKHATADFVRAGRDDVMFYTPSGSWLYAGLKAYPWLQSNVWHDASLTYSTVEWFGTQ